MTPQDSNPDVLDRALQKTASGRGTSGTEKKAIHDFETGKIGRDHFAAIATTLVRLPNNALPKSPPANAIYQVDGLEAALRAVGNSADSTDLTALTARVAALETLLSGFARRSIDVCDAGTAKTMTIVSTAPA